MIAKGFEVVDQAVLGGLGGAVAGEVVVAEFAVGSLVMQDVPDDHNEGVGGCDGGLSAAVLAEPAVEAVELGADVAAGLARRPGTFGQDVADFGIALAGAAGFVSAGGFVVAPDTGRPRMPGAPRWGTGTCPHPVRR